VPGPPPCVLSPQAATAKKPKIQARRLRVI
jgi:hypothetical protein